MTISILVLLSFLLSFSFSLDNVIEPKQQPLLRQSRDRQLSTTALSPALLKLLSAPSQPIPPLPGKWILSNSNIPNLQKRHEACFVMVNRTAVLIGGRGSNKRPNLYNPVTQIWTLGAPAPIELHHFQGVVIRNQIWIVGAWTGKFPREQTVNYTYIYDPFADTWQTRPPMPLNRRRGSTAAVAVADRFIYVAFGNIGGHETGSFATSYNWFDRYDTITGAWTVLPNASYPRDHTGGVLMADGRLCFAGGRDGGTIGWPTVNQTECYNITSNSWTIEAPVPTPRAGASYGRSCKGELYMVGGELYSQNIVLGNFDVFNGKTWTRYANVNIPRHSTGLAVDCICNDVVIASGSGTAGSDGELTNAETFYPTGIVTSCLA